MTWIEDPSYPNTTLSWNIIEGKLMLVHIIFAYSLITSKHNSEAVNMNLQDLA